MDAMTATEIGTDVKNLRREELFAGPLDGLKVEIAYDVDRWVSPQELVEERKLYRPAIYLRGVDRKFRYDYGQLDRPVKAAKA